MNSPKVIILGGGIAGIASAVILSERGIDTTIIEKEDYLGGRAGAFPITLKTGETVEMERGFHAFFRQYYNLRSLLSRISPDLSILKPLDDYPIVGYDNSFQSFSKLPKRAPWNLIALTRRNTELTWKALRKIKLRPAISMLAYHQSQTYKRYDNESATSYLNSLNFPPKARQMLFDVFSHSFFNPEESMSAAELLMMFHFYFMGNREGLIFDVIKSPFSNGLWKPMRNYLEKKSVKIFTGESANSINHVPEGWEINTSSKGKLSANAVVVALNVPGLKNLIANSILNHAPWNKEINRLEVTLPFVVWRLWLDCPIIANPQIFAGTAGFPYLDNISLIHLFQDESKNWADIHKGSVVELHAYAVPTSTKEATIKEAMINGLHKIYPETKTANILDEVYMLRQDCPAFNLNTYNNRPTVITPHSNLYLAGDFVRLDQPSALMERATIAGMTAANFILKKWGYDQENILSVGQHGIFPSIAA